MMRYQRVSPDNVSLSNGRRSNYSPSSWRTCKEDESGSSGDIHINGRTTIPTSTFEGKGLLPRFRSPSKTQDQNSSVFCGVLGSLTENNHQPPDHDQDQDQDQASSPTGNQSHAHEIESNSSRNGGGGGGDHVLLQWGHRKRSRCSRNEIRGLGLTTDELSSSSSSMQFLARQANKVHKRVAPAAPAPAPGAGMVVVVVDDNNKLSRTTNSMPPPPAPSSTSGRCENLKPCSKPKDTTSAFFPIPNRKNLEERSGGGSQSPPSDGGGGSRVVSSTRSKVGKRSAPVAEKFNRKTTPSSSGSMKVNGCSLTQEAAAAAANKMNHIVSAPPQSDQQATDSSINDDNNITAAAMIMTGGTGTATGGEIKVNGGGGGELNGWPRIFIPLSRKEKEEDFLVMKGTKLPHRPKKRPKTVDRILQYCLPGMWLSDITRGRYEVREKKCAKKQKRRGLKGMESMDSDSE